MPFVVVRPALLVVAATVLLAACANAEPPAAATPRPTRDPASLGTVLTLTAKALAFDLRQLAVAPSQAFAIELDNQDAGSVPHDVDLRGPDGKVIVDNATVAGGRSGIFDFPALAPGTYTYICSVHPVPAMTGTLEVR